MARTFASDNNSGVHSSVLVAVADANDGHVHAYGDDPWTARGIRALRGLLGDSAEVFFVFNGTGANVTALSSLMRSGDAVVTPATAHIACDECGAPERFTGCKVITVPTADGKLRPADVEPLLAEHGNMHHVQPRVISISQVAETGTVYTADEVRSLADLAHAHGMYVHMDGARLANAAVALDVEVRSFTTDAGVDVVSFGGTKNGLLFGEAVCFLTPGLSDGFLYERKSGGQLASKMRFVGAQFAAMYGSSLWHECASNANAMAARLSAAATAAGVVLEWPAEANEVFAVLPTGAVSALQAVADFYVWETRGGDAVVRWVCSWDTTPEDVDRFVAAIPGALKGA
ncbi:MAG: aminotransferase class V-fold PLP-dependent enzyme [Coriobacteriia bacterium]|nr:aminotransferase class V-fold PLP-dependent enzyme [Coriobacteriia bacterium]